MLGWACFIVSIAIENWDGVVYNSQLTYVIIVYTKLEGFDAPRATVTRKRGAALRSPANRSFAAPLSYLVIDKERKSTTNPSFGGKNPRKCFSFS
jgi:hypothetical protein